MFLIFFFFFSSRRRHTRLQGDWSSDVCSSDLGYGHEDRGRPHDVDAVMQERRDRDAQQATRRGNATDREVGIGWRGWGIEHEAVKTWRAREIVVRHTVGPSERVRYRVTVEPAHHRTIADRFIRS